MLTGMAMPGGYDRGAAWAGMSPINGANDKEERAAA